MVKTDMTNLSLEKDRFIYDTFYCRGDTFVVEGNRRWIFYIFNLNRVIRLLVTQASIEVSQL